MTEGVCWGRGRWSRPTAPWGGPRRGEENVRGEREGSPARVQPLTVVASLLLHLVGPARLRAAGARVRAARTRSSGLPAPTPY